MDKHALLAISDEIEFDENRTDFERAVAIFRKTPKRVSCNLK
jgi:hypothetical protein